MGRLESIKQKIRQLDAGSFQNLCDAYLAKKDYKNIVSLGGEAGTKKTTRGTPDTYFTMENDKYIFVEYTTQKYRLLKKIIADIDKCLDVSKTGISYDRISEIIYCHTSSNIKPVQYEEITCRYKNYGIKISLFGIDTIAMDLYHKYPILAHDFLDMPISTEQILLVDDFIRIYNSNKLVAQIDTKFVLRENELKNIEQAYEKSNVVILNGPAGVGKTRLALHYIESYAKSSNEKVFCIKNNSLPIYEDLKMFIDTPGNYFIFIDDANQLSELGLIVQELNMKSDDYNIKILITVRNYALNKVIKDINDITLFEIVYIAPFSDNDIKVLLETSLGIFNSRYQERIMYIAEGNARIAILAGKIACEHHKLDSINDVSSLYEKYYGKVLMNQNLDKDRKLCATAGIAAFMGRFQLAYIDKFESFLNLSGLDKADFTNNLFYLHRSDFIDIYYDNVVCFTDQCLCNFLLKYIFYDKKIIKLSEVIKVYFNINRDKTIFSINTLLNVFYNEDINQFVEKEIKIVWNELEAENSPIFIDFVKVFYRLNPTDTFVLLNSKIESERKVLYKEGSIDTESGKDSIAVDNEILAILGGFADSKKLATACDLFFLYYLKRPDLYIQFYHAAKTYYGVTKYSKYNDYYTISTFIEKMKEYSSNWNEEAIIVLFFDVARSFLNLIFMISEQGRKNTISMYNIHLEISNGVIKYRKLIWDTLIYLSENKRYKSKIKKIINGYGGSIYDESNPVLEFDLPYINEIMKNTFDSNDLKDCIHAYNLYNIYSKKEIDTKDIFSIYLKSDDIEIYMHFKSCECKKREVKFSIIKKYVMDNPKLKTKKIIDFFENIRSYDRDISWKFQDEVIIFFDIISEIKDLYIEAVQYYIEKDISICINPISIIKKLFIFLSDSEVYKIISEREYSQKDIWMYTYFVELPEDSICTTHIQRLYKFLNDTYDSNIMSSPGRNVEFLDKYSKIDPDIFLNGCRVILDKRRYSPYIVYLYFEKLFIEYDDKVLVRFNKDLDLLEEMYIAVISHEEWVDYNGCYLYKIYELKQSILKKYIDFMLKNKCIRDCQKRNKCFFHVDNYVEVYNYFLDEVFNDRTLCNLEVEIFIESIILPGDSTRNFIEKINVWIKQYIKSFSKEKRKMYCIFSVIAKLKTEQRIEYILFFLQNNAQIEDFKNIPLTPTSYTVTNSAVPIYSGWIEFLEKLLPSLEGLKWLCHKNYIEREIEYLNKKIEDEEMKDILSR